MSSGTSTPVSEERLLTGRSEAPEIGQWLRAGRVSALLVDGDLRTITVDGVEVVRRIYVAVRDLDWNTIPGRISAWRLDARSDSFEVSFTSRHTQGDLDFECDVQIGGSSDGNFVSAGRREKGEAQNQEQDLFHGVAIKGVALNSLSAYMKPRKHRDSRRFKFLV